MLFDKIQMFSQSKRMNVWKVCLAFTNYTFSFYYKKLKKKSKVLKSQSCDKILT
jgi:hypothetical protein